MGLLEALKDQFLDVIEYQDPSGKLIVVKYQRESGNDEIKQGSKVIVRQSQMAVFMKGGVLAEILPPGTYSLTTGNFPILTTLKAFPFLFTSPVVSDLYFVSTKQFLDQKWATKNPILKRDADFGIARIRAFGKYAFRIVNVELFMKKVFGTRGLMMSYDIAGFFGSLLAEIFAKVIGEQDIPLLDLTKNYGNLAKSMEEELNRQAQAMGVGFSGVCIENISLPDEVEKLIDEQSGISIATKDMNGFLQYQSARAMREACQTGHSLAGMGAGIALAGVMGETMAKAVTTADKKEEMLSVAARLRELKSLLDDGILTQEEFEQEKKTILSK